MINGANKFIEKGLQAKHERREGLLQIYRDVKNYYLRSKAKKIIAKNEKKLKANLSINHKDKQSTYIEELLTSDQPTGSMLYDWDKRDGNKKENGGYKFSQIGHSLLYKENISDNELDLFKKHSTDIANIILHTQPQRIIDMGGGNGLKTAKILSILPTNVLANITITTKDISAHLGEEYKKNLEIRNREYGNVIKTGFIYEDFLEKHELQSNKDKRIFLFKGGSIGQFDDHNIKQIFENMISESIFGKRYIFMTAFIAPDKNSSDYENTIHKLVATYGSPDKGNPYYDQTTHKYIQNSSSYTSLVLICYKKI